MVIDLANPPAAKTYTPRVLAQHFRIRPDRTDAEIAAKVPMLNRFIQRWGRSAPIVCGDVRVHRCDHIENERPTLRPGVGSYLVIRWMAVLNVALYHHRMVREHLDAHRREPIECRIQVG